jgi:LysM repeat protein
MKIYIINLFASVLLLFIFAGCAPQLARTKYGTTENQWKGYIQESYKDWEPPPTTPPISNSVTSGDTAESISIDIVPEPMPDNNLTLSGKNNNVAILPEITSVSPDSKQLASDTITYTVIKGDTLWSISCKFYNNDGTKWKKIQEANKNILTSPGDIKPGLTLTIPTK